ncbi:MAG: CDC27 family protein [Candidatus Melainabacteria bacterium]|nr:CDC27 family protein [Candidatus Melainabacteria bacterium]
MNRSVLVMLVALLAGCASNNNPDQLSSQAGTLIAGGKYKKSLKLYDAAILQSDKDSALYAKRGTVKSLLMDYDGALNDLNRAIELRSDVGWYHSKRSMLLGELKQADAAIDSANKAVQLDPADEQTLAYRAKAYALNGQYEKALQDALQSAKHGGDLVYTYKVLATCYIHLGKPDEALDSIRKAITLNESDPTLICLKSEAEMQKLDLKQAIKTAQTAQKKNPEAIEPYSCLARAYLLLGDNEKAKQNIDIVSEKSPTDGQALLAVYYISTRQAEKALETASVVAKNHPSPDAQMTLAEAYTISGRGTEALKIADTLSKEYPDLAAVHRTRALALIGLGKYDEAASAASESIRILKYNPFAYRLRSEALACNGDADGARRDRVESQKLGYLDSLPQEGMLLTLKQQLAKEQTPVAAKPM